MNLYYIQPCLLLVGEVDHTTTNIKHETRDFRPQRRMTFSQEHFLCIEKNKRNCNELL